MNGGEESDEVVVPMKQANNATEKQAEAAEFVEGKTPTKERSGPHVPGTVRARRVPPIRLGN